MWDFLSQCGFGTLLQNFYCFCILHAQILIIPNQHFRSIIWSLGFAIFIKIHNHGTWFFTTPPQFSL